MTLRPVLLAILLAASALPAANVAVNLSGTTNQPFANKLVDTDVQVARFVLQASGGDVTIDGITIDFSNPTNAALAFSGVRLFYDANGNGTFEDPAEELGSVQAVGTGAVTFTETFTALNGLIRELQVRVHIGNNVAVYGEAFQAGLTPQAALFCLAPAAIRSAERSRPRATRSRFATASTSLCKALATRPRRAQWPKAARVFPGFTSSLIARWQPTPENLWA